MYNWDDLRHFLAVSRHGSLNAAARSLGVDQSTVFRRLRSLEQYLGTQVFDRRKHGKYELTAAGESLAIQAGLIEEASFNIEREVRGQDLELSGKIRVTTAEDIAVVLLPPHLQAFEQKYPEISVEVITGNRYFSLSRGEADIAIRPATSSSEDRVIPRRICRTFFGLFASSSYIEAAGSPSDWQELANHKVIRWIADLAEDGFANILNEYGDPELATGSNSLMTQRAMAERGMGIAFLPEFVGRIGTDLLRVMPQVRIDSGFIWMLHHDDMRHVARVRAFVDFMTEAFRDDPGINLE